MGLSQQWSGLSQDMDGINLAGEWGGDTEPIQEEEAGEGGLNLDPASPQKG